MKLFNRLSFNAKKMALVVAARSSPLSQVQVNEVLAELVKFHPQVTFKSLLLSTYGDGDQKTSLRGLPKSSDFFTREVDIALSEGRCDAAIHSAKDVPEPIKPGLTIAAITKGIDSRDVLVLKEGCSLESLPDGATIATSSARREESVLALKKNVLFQDVRGTIEQRLALLNTGKVDGVVVAWAALYRLNLGHLNAITLPGETAPLQGKLAILVRQDALSMLKLFTCIDSRYTETHSKIGFWQRENSRD